MKYAYCFLGVVPVRKEPTSLSEQVTQLVFGDYVQVLGIDNGWTKILNLADNYEGYVDSLSLIHI